MTHNESIDAKAETLHRRTTHLRKLVALEAPDVLIARELSLCAQGVADVALVMKAKHDPPPVRTGQGVYVQDHWLGEEPPDDNL